MHDELVLLFGGSCSERRVSVASAQHLVTLLERPACWFWSPDGALFEVTPQSLLAHERPFETDFSPPGKPRYTSLEAALDDATPIQTFVLALHGGAGEDGTVQSWLEERRLYFTGSSAAASRTAFDKILAKERLRERGVRVAESIVVFGRDPKLDEQLRDMLGRSGRLVLKPVADGSSAGLCFLNAAADLAPAAAQLRTTPAVPHLLEAFIEGTELTVGVIDTPDGPRALPCSEVQKEVGRAFDYAGKYLGKGIREITPASVPAAVHAAAGQVAVAAHQATGCRGYSRTDQIYTADGSVFLEINNLPGMTRASFIPQQLAAAGIPIKDFLAQQLELARTRYMTDGLPQAAVARRR
jgi:D-alanine-D-alanine ligase